MDATAWAAVAAWTSAVASFIMLYLFRKQVVLDHKRRRKEATLKAVAEVFPSIRQLLTLEPTDGNEPRLIPIMDRLEFLAIGFRSRVYDRDVGRHMLGNWFEEAIEHAMPLILRIRKQHGHEGAYSDSIIFADESHPRPQNPGVDLLKGDGPT